MSEHGPLTIGDVINLGVICDAAAGCRRIRWQTPAGDIAEGTARALTHDGGGFIRHDEDVRDAFLHVSATFEQWIPVAYLMTLVGDGLFAIDR